jgi:transcriptional regulator with XRE-family HTH domain
VRKLAQDFGIRLKEARKRAGLSRTELARRLGTHQVYISLLERGGENPTLAACEKYAKALG